MLSVQYDAIVMGDTCYIVQFTRGLMCQLKKITIVIPTHYRHFYLQRLLDYYQGIDINILVVDSSDTQFPLRNNYTNTQYLFYPDMPFHEKMAAAFQNVPTPYVALCADDDFIIPSSIIHCLEFLEKNSDHSSVQGHSVSFFNEMDPVAVPLYLNIVGHNVSAETASERITQCVNPYMPHFYCVHRTQNLKFFFQHIHNQIPNYNLGELAMVFIDAINGKHKILPTLLVARETYQGAVVRYPISGVVNICTAPELRAEYEKFLALVTPQFCRATGVSQVDGQRCIEQAIEDYLRTCFNVERKSNSLLLKLKEWIYKSLRPYMPRALLNYRRNRHVMHWKQLPGYPFSDSEAKREWDVIRSVVAMHYKPT